jgi:hypothetical protein
VKRETTPKNKKTPKHQFPPGAGETTKGELCGSLTLLQDEITFLFGTLDLYMKRSSVLQSFNDEKKSNTRLPGAPGGSWKGLNFKSSATFPLVPVRSALKQQGIKCKR